MTLYELKITGQLTIVPCSTVEDNSWTILIMGPTGAGKSTFIEALAGEGQSLGISKNQLDGYTQEITAYKMQNVIVQLGDGYTRSMYFIDTPGFSDSKISEMEIISKIKGWMKERGLVAIRDILYLCPITDPRVPGSKRRTIKMLQSLLYEGSAPSVTIVTTMWDMVSSPKAKERADANFAQLQDDIWKELIDKGAHLDKFQNSHTSAIDIVRNVIEYDTTWNPLEYPPISGSDPCAPLLYRELLDRINNARQEIESLNADKMHLMSKPDPLLESIVLPRLDEVKQDLTKLYAQLIAFGDPPPQFSDIPERVGYQNLLVHVDTANSIKADLGFVFGRVSPPEPEEMTHAKYQAAMERVAELSKAIVLYGEVHEGLQQALQDALAAPKYLPHTPPSLPDVHNLAAMPSSLAHPPHLSPTVTAPDAARNVRLSSAETPDSGSISSRTSMRDRVKKGVKSIGDQLTSPFKRGPRS